MASETVFNNLSKFVFKRVLNNSSDRKVIFLEASLENGEKLVVILEKKAFTEEIAKQLFSKSSILNKEFINDVYGSYECIPDVKLNGIKTTVIYPATEDHIKKFQFQPFHVIEESPKAYESITLPYVIENKLSLQWVHNILDHKTEVDRIVFEDFDKEAGFVLLPDLKWDGKQIETLYLLAICHCRNIKSLRDLNASHLPLLKNILTSGTKAIKDRYNIDRSRLRSFIHYQPSFYHFHVHFTYIDFEPPGGSFDRSHALITVINNIELVSDYYQRSTIPFLAKQSEGLTQKYIDKGIIKKVLESNESS